MKQTGQTLIELVISITLIVLIITAVTILTVNGLKNSQFSRNQIQATKLAQEGVEKMRTLRDNNSTVCGSPTVGINAIVSNGLWGISCVAPGCNYLLKTPANICGTGSVINTTATWIQYTTLTTDYESININGVIFKRIITIANGTALPPASNSNVKEVTVTVSWTDSSGSHNSKVSTILTNI